MHELIKRESVPNNSLQQAPRSGRISGVSSHKRLGFKWAYNGMELRVVQAAPLPLKRDAPERASGISPAPHRRCGGVSAKFEGVRLTTFSVRQGNK
jgi:hypothetical protein